LGNFLVRKGAPLLDVSATTRDCLKYVEMIQNIVEGTVVG